MAIDLSKVTSVVTRPVGNDGGPVVVQLSGSNVTEDGAVRVLTMGTVGGLLTHDATSAATVGASQSHLITIRPPVGELWRVRLLRFNAPAVSAASSGNHWLGLRVGEDSADHEILFAQFAYNGAVSVHRNVVVGTTIAVAPTTEHAQAAVLQSLVFDNTTPLRVRYANSTNGAQEGARTLKLVVEVEHLG